MKKRIGSLLLLILLALMLKPGAALAYYDPELGRFIQPDTIIPDLSNPQSYNRYSYCLNDPLRYTDPTGHAGDDDDDIPMTLGAAHAMLRVQVGGASAALYRQAGPELGRVAAIGQGVAEMNPVVGVANGGISAVTGRDAVTQAQLSGWQRVLAGIGGVVSIIPGEGAEAEAGATILKNAERGRAAEAKVLNKMGLVKNTEKVATPEGKAIPDALTGTMSVEIKDAQAVNKTKQVRIETDAAKATGQQSVLVTGANTKVSGPAQQSFDQIIRRDDLGPQK